MVLSSVGGSLAHTLTGALFSWTGSAQDLGPAISCAGSDLASYKGRLSKPLASGSFWPARRGGEVLLITLRASSLALSLSLSRRRVDHPRSAALPSGRNPNLNHRSPRQPKTPALLPNLADRHTL